jgi:hypothetical protein
MDRIMGGFSHEVLVIVLIFVCVKCERGQCITFLVFKDGIDNGWHLGLQKLVVASQNALYTPYHLILQALACILDGSCKSDGCRLVRTESKVADA